MAKQTYSLQWPEYKEIEAYLTCSYDYLTCPIIGLEKCGKLELEIKINENKIHRKIIKQNQN